MGDYSTSEAAFYFFVIVHFYSPDTIYIHHEHKSEKDSRAASLQNHLTIRFRVDSEHSLHQENRVKPSPGKYIQHLESCPNVGLTVLGWSRAKKVLGPVSLVR